MKFSHCFKTAAVTFSLVFCLFLCGCSLTKGTGAGYDSFGKFSFNIVNTSSADIYSVHMGLQNADAEADIDLLPGYIRVGETKTVNSTVKNKSQWGVTAWTIYVADMNGKTSVDYELFDPWTVKIVEIVWNETAGGYKCQFIYDEK